MKYGYHCHACGVYGKQLEAHECYEFQWEEGIATFVEVVALCGLCHHYIHSFRVLALLKRKKIRPEQVAMIMAHGTRVLQEAGFKMLCPPTPEKVAPDKQWRLSYKDKIYYPDRKSLAYNQI